MYIHRAQRPDGEASAAALAYWQQVFDADELPAPLDLPADRPREAARSYRGDTVHRALDAGLSQRLRHTAKSLKTSVYVLLLAGFQALVSRLSGQEDFVIGVPVAGQARLNLETVGYCVNALPLRAAPAHDKAFAQLVAETQRT